MKKLISVLLAAVMLLGCAVPALAVDAKKPGFGEYEHVFIIGVDGAGAAFELVDSPNFDRIFADNAYRHNAVTEYITTSAQNWGSILLGVDYETHGMTNDSTKENRHTSADEYHSIFYYARQAMPKAKLVSVCHWANINYGIIEDDINVKKENRFTDTLVVDEVIHKVTIGKAPTLMFVQLDDVDHAAHTYGGFSEEYYAAVETMDTNIGRIYDAIESKGLMENSLFILVADHGETAGGHGGQTVEESSAILAVAGKSVNKCILPESAHNRDVSAIALYALGIEQPDAFISSVPDGLFGEAREKTVAENPMELTDKLLNAFYFPFIRGFNLIMPAFAWIYDIVYHAGIFAI
ncbi:MAG: alkaline phosphatase family protein [Clostridia bacterium]|nr:alkaline phosphatase family protein [Clostridia bacterium]